MRQGYFVAKKRFVVYYFYNMTHPKEERTFVMVKPDGVFRGLVGEVLSRFEKRGLKIVALKMVWPTREHIDKHYPEHDEWFDSVGSRTSEFFKGKGMDVKEHFGTEDAIEIGKQVKNNDVGKYFSKVAVSDGTVLAGDNQGNDKCGG